MKTTKSYTTISEYIESFPAEIQKVLKKIRLTIQKEAPIAKEIISYGIPTFKLTKNLVHFAAYKNHIGFYPGGEAVEVFAADLQKYKTSKGTIQFQLSEPIPYELITKITKYRVSKESESESKY